MTVTVFTWPLVVPGLPTPGSSPSSGYLAAGLGVSSPVPDYYTEADLLAILDRILPAWFLDPLKSPGPGYELYQAAAAMLSRCSLAVGRFEVGAVIAFSHGGALATATVEFYRQAATAGAFTLRRGSIVRTSRTNRAFYVVDDVAFGALDLVVAGQVKSVAPAYEYNVPGPVFTADGTLLPGEIDDLVIPYMTPVYAEPTLRVRQVSDATGGQPAVLDQLGGDRDLPRLPTETDEVYKGRVRSLPDTVSPDALRRQLDAVFLPLGFSYKLIETWQSEYCSCWDAPTGASQTNTGFMDEAVLAYDAPAEAVFRGRWMGIEDCPAGVVVVVPILPSWLMRGAAYDDYADDTNTPAAWTTAVGRRAVSAYDAPDSDSTTVLTPFYDGDDLLLATFYARLQAMLNQVKGGGMEVAIELEGQ